MSEEAVTTRWERTPHTTPCVDGPREFVDIQEALHYHALANGDGCWRDLLSQAAVEIEHLRDLLAEANEAFDEVTGDYPKELVEGEEWRTAARRTRATEGADHG